MIVIEPGALRMAHPQPFAVMDDCIQETIGKPTVRIRRLAIVHWQFDRGIVDA